MFNYNNFKAEMVKRGHEVSKKGKYITIEPDNNYQGYRKGFLYAADIIEGYDDFLEPYKIDHFNTHIYSAKFKIA